MEMDFEGVKTARLCHGEFCERSIDDRMTSLTLVVASSVRKKSIEVPLENLLSGVVFLSGNAVLQ